jgi:hypothetical protein
MGLSKSQSYVADARWCTQVHTNCHLSYVLVDAFLVQKAMQINHKSPAATDRLASDHNML